MSGGVGQERALGTAMLLLAAAGLAYLVLVPDGGGGHGHGHGHGAASMQDIMKRRQAELLHAEDTGRSSGGARGHPRELGTCEANGIVFNGVEDNVPYEGGPEGSCWCGSRDGYCLCTPSLAVDVVLETEIDGEPALILGERKFEPLGWALIGGFVNVGETAEAAAAREVFEETNLELYDIEQVHLFSSPQRDPRRHGASMLFRAKVRNEQALQAGDDAAKAARYKLADIHRVKLAFADHLIMIEAYKRFRQRHRGT